MFYDNGNRQDFRKNMELKYSLKERIAGVFVIGSVLLLLISLVIIGRGKDWFSKYIPYYTIFEESYNVQNDTPVKLLDTNIGKVKNVFLLGDQVRVELLILEQYASRIRSGAFATVSSPTFIGSEYVSIKPGKNKEAPLIPPGGLIPSTPRRSIADLLEEFQVEKTAKLIVQAVQEISELVHTLRDPQGPLLTMIHDFASTLAHVELLSRDLQAGKGSVGALLKSNDLTNRINADLDRIGLILDHIETAAAKSPAAMNRVQDNLEVIHSVGDSLIEGVEAFKEVMKELKSDLDAVKVIINNLEKASFDAPDVTRSAVEGIKEARNSLENIDKVIMSLQQNFLIRSNLPPEPVGKNIDAGLRE